MRNRIYFLINSLEWGWAERVVSRLSNILIDGVDIDIITLKSWRTAYILDKRIRIITLSDIKRHNIFLFFLIPYFVYRMRWLLRKNNYVSGISFLEISNFVHIISRKNALISMRTSLWFFEWIIGMVYKYCIKLLYPHARKIIVNSEENKYKLWKFLKIGSEDVITIYNPIDTKEVLDLASEEMPPEVEDICRGKKVFVTTGRLIKSKNQLAIIRSFRHILEPAVLLILWEGPERILLERTIQELELSKNVFLLGFKENIFPYIHRADYFIYASQVEWFPNAILEAMTLKKPIISTDFETWARECILGRYIPWIPKSWNSLSTLMKA